MNSTQKSTESKDHVWPDHVQLRLRMSSEQINTRREEDRARARDSDGKSAKRFFDVLHVRPWHGVSRKISPNSKDSAYWQRAADVAHGIAIRKTEKKHRKYWNKMARRYEEKAND